MKATAHIVDFSLTNWEGLPLSQYRQPPIAEPGMLVRTDGVGLVYEGGRFHILYGESESGKSLLAMMACLQEVREGRHVFYYDFEDYAALMQERFTAVGASSADSGKLLYAEVAGEGWNERAHDTVLGQIENYEPRLVVMDSFDELLAANSISPNDADGVRRIRQRVLDPIMARGASLLMIDHTPKGGDTRGTIAGSQAKKSQLTGSALKVERVKEFGIGTDPGLVRVSIEKDRPARLRRHAVRGGLVAEAHFIPGGGGLLTINMEPPPMTASGEYDHTWVKGRLLDVLGEESLSSNELRKRYRDSGGKGSDHILQEAIGQLVDEGQVRSVGQGRSRKLIVA